MPVNPMLRAREREVVLADSGARVLVALEALRPRRRGRPRTPVHVITTSELELPRRAGSGAAGRHAAHAGCARTSTALIEAYGGRRAGRAATPDPPTSPC